MEISFSLSLFLCGEEEEEEGKGENGFGSMFWGCVFVSFFRFCFKARRREGRWEGRGGATSRQKKRREERETVK